MLKRILGFLMLAIFVIACKTQKTDANNAGQKIINVQPKALENALLWKIEGKDIQKPSYLYGTIHIIENEDFFYPNGTLSAIDATEKMVFEIDMADMEDMSKIMGLMKKAFMKDNLTLKDLLEPADYVLVEDHFKKMGMPLMMFERMKPMFLTVFAGGDMNPMDFKSGKIKSYEMEFAKIAESANMTTGGLETIDFQLSVFDSIPYEAQADMLMESIKGGDTAGDQFKEMVEMYKTQNLEAMSSMIDEDESTGEFSDILLVQRNKNWIPIMSEMMAIEPVFFAVGAGHLGGNYGVINLLRKEGYRLTPISMAKKS